MLKIIFYVFLIFVVIGAIKGGPAIAQIIQCHVEENKVQDNINYDFNMSKISDAVKCKQEQDTIFNLDHCVGNVKDTSKLPAQFFQYLYKYLPLVRADIKSIDTIKSTHDAGCTKYPDTQFEFL